MRIVVCAACVAVIVAAGCGRKEEQELRRFRYDGPPAADVTTGALPVDVFNEYAAEVDEPWEHSPVMAAAEFVQLDQHDARRTTTTIDAHHTLEGWGPQVVTVTFDGYLDQNLVKAERYVLTFIPDGDTFRLKEGFWGLQCRPGKGHQDFSAQPCV